VISSFLSQSHDLPPLPVCRSNKISPNEAVSMLSSARDTGCNLSAHSLDLILIDVSPSLPLSTVPSLAVFLIAVLSAVLFLWQ
jgi:hypothetical protein